jgi:acetyltransferase-like isoleucine patch superfamily enzyme
MHDIAHSSDAAGTRIIPATHGHRQTLSALPHEREMIQELQGYSPEERLELYARFATGANRFDAMMRRIIISASAAKAGPGLTIDSAASFRHLETIRFGSDVFVGTHAVIQGRYDGHAEIGSNTWIGPHVFIDARALTIGRFVGLGPGCRILGSTHTGEPMDRPVIATDLVEAPVHIEDGADIGINAVILPGVRVGKGAIIGAGAVVTADIPAYCIAAGVPARVMRRRADKKPVNANGA